MKHLILAGMIALSAGAAKADPVSHARQYLGMNARQIGLHRTTLWCSAFLQFIVGKKPGVDDRAISWKARPRTSGYVGSIAIVRSRRMHVGIVSGYDNNGNPILISGNHNGRVAETAYPKGRVVAFVQP